MYRNRFTRNVTLLTILIGVFPYSPAHSATSNYPTRIISLSPSATEILYAIGAGPQVIAVDDNSNFPKSAPLTKLSSFTPNVEAIAARHPDLVVLQATATSAQAVQTQLQKLGIKVFLEKTPNQLADAYSEFLALGKITGSEKNSAKVVSNMKQAINKILSTVDKSKQFTIYHELDNTLYSASSTTFIGRIYSDFRLVNIADPANTASAAGYPQLTSEYIVKKNPAIIFLADGQYGESGATLKARPGWAGLSALSHGHVVVLPADIPNRWGPRLVDLYRFIGKSMTGIH
jgi:iron complex transport system substrate-binding protein